ncbi:BLUF domain-containing protein [Maricaulis sp.]|uniref:BLUF domain-containing protein n=1 Tax=Maricaulis sp. TaxID=1486257 RepID=UPI00261B9E5C|nr:BLUF domain-containing protein [Maricaulis sp.]
MLHRMVLVARSNVELGRGALNGDLGIMLSRLMKASVDGCMTGALLWESGHFLEVLEGDRETLNEFRARITGDARIERLQVLEFLPLLRREYSTWAIARRRHDRAGPDLLRDLAGGRVSAEKVRFVLRESLAAGPLAESPPLVVAA